MPAAPTDWHAAAAAADLPTRPFVDGLAVEPHTDATFDTVGARDGEVLTTLPDCGAEDVDRAVAAARRSFEEGTWRDAAPAHRKAVLLRFAELVRDHADELALLETLDAGKPIGDTTSVDVPACASTLQWYAEAADKVYDEVGPTAADRLSIVRRQPAGVVAAVVPWNYPLIITAWKLGPALAAGNSVVLKPAEQTPLATLRLAALGAEAGLPDGVLNVLPGLGPSTGQALGRHPDVDVLAFTGSVETGRRFLRYAADSNLKEVSLELGGKSPQIVFADAPDLDAAAEAIAWGIFYNAGQTCHAGSRVVVEASVRDDLVARVARVAEGIQPGDPLDPTTTMGAIVSAEQHRGVLDYLEAGAAAGATTALGGAPVDVVEGGCYVPPTILTDVTADMAVGREEIFGPVVTVHTFEGPAASGRGDGRTGVDRAVAVGNDTPYGLAASVWTSDVSTAHRVARDLRAGTVWINTFDTADVTVPFGGWKLSGFGGRDKSLHALDTYTELKSTWLQL